MSSPRMFDVRVDGTEGLPDVLTLRMDASGVLTWASARAEAVLGQRRDEIPGTDLRRLVGTDVMDEALTKLKASADGYVPINVDVRRPDGTVSRLTGTLEALPGDDQDGLFATLADITGTMALKEAYAHTLLHDEQTHLHNRLAFDDRLREAMERTIRDDAPFALVVGELDGFHDLNLHHSSDVLDTILEIVGARIGTIARGVDTAARVGVDRFALILHDCPTARDAELVAGRLQQAVKAPLKIDAVPMPLSMTCGIAIAETASGGSLDELTSRTLQDAGMALAEARRLGLGRRVVAREELRATSRRRSLLQRELVGALERGEFLLHYQPIFDLTDLTIEGVEALLRWNHPDLGTVSPGEFVPLAESTGLIVPIGAWVLQEACRQVAQWNARFPSDVPLHVSINVSAHQLAHANLSREVALAMAVSGTAEGTLTVELTEAALMANRAVAQSTLADLRELGVRLALDDFGTGSSLDHLQQFTFDEIKIERQFAAVDGGAGENLADALISFGRSLDVLTVAEGIEDREQLERFQRLGCERGQGYFLGRPAVGAEIEALLAARASSIRSDPTAAPPADDATEQDLADDTGQLLRDLARGI